nr:unnamed protein product [Digitaria exilis]
MIKQDERRQTKPLREVLDTFSNATGFRGSATCGPGDRAGWVLPIYRAITACEVLDVHYTFENILLRTMASGLITADDASTRDYGSGVMFPVVMTCLMAASCGLVYGYNNGISDGVTQVESFLSKFVPGVLLGTKDSTRDIYCKYDNQWLTAFTSSLLIAAALSSLVASHVTRMVGRQVIMLLGGALFLVGSIINAGAMNIAMLVIGRMLLGFGIGFTFQVHIHVKKMQNI